jgi:hypothetical protein
MRWLQKDCVLRLCSVILTSAPVLLIAALCCVLCHRWLHACAPHLAMATCVASFHVLLYMHNMHSCSSQLAHYRPAPFHLPGGCLCCACAQTCRVQAACAMFAARQSACGRLILCLQSGDALNVSYQCRAFCLWYPCLQAHSQSGRALGPGVHVCWDQWGSTACQRPGSHPGSNCCCCCCCCCRRCRRCCCCRPDTPIRLKAGMHVLCSMLRSGPG